MPPETDWRGDTTIETRCHECGLRRGDHRGRDGRCPPSVGRNPMESAPVWWARSNTNFVGTGAPPAWCPDTPCRSCGLAPRHHRHEDGACRPSPEVYAAACPLRNANGGPLSNREWHARYWGLTTTRYGAHGAPPTWAQVREAAGLEIRGAARDARWTQPRWSPRPYELRGSSAEFHREVMGEWVPLQERAAAVAKMDLSELLGAPTPRHSDQVDAALYVWDRLAGPESEARAQRGAAAEPLPSNRDIAHRARPGDAVEVRPPPAAALAPTLVQRALIGEVDPSPVTPHRPIELDGPRAAAADGNIHAERFALLELDRDE